MYVGISLNKNKDEYTLLTASACASMCAYDAGTCERVPIPNACCLNVENKTD